MTLSPHTVFTPVEVARALRVTSETIRRKIQSGELGAIEVGGTQRKQYRITMSDLSRWLGPERAAQLFGIGSGLAALEQALGAIDSDTLEREVEGATRAVRAQRSHAEGSDLLPTPTTEEIERRFRR